MALIGDTFVPRRMHDDMIAQLKEQIVFLRDQLAQKDKDMLALRIAGANAPLPPKPGRVVPPGPSEEARAAQRMHTDMVDRIADEIKRIPGIDPTVADREAQRLRDAALGTDGLP